MGPIEELILLVRGQKVMIDADLARIYGVVTKALNQAAKRNRERFPSDFMFRLTPKEVDEIWSSSTHAAAQNRSQIVTGSQKHRDPRFLPYVFTEHGAIMAANVLNSPIAVQASIQVVRAFARLHEMLASNKDLARKLEALENKYDKQFRVVFDAIRELMRPQVPKGRKIGYKIRD